MTASNLIIDTNLFVLLIVGSTNRKYIAAHKRLKKYDETDFDLVLRVTQGFREIVLIPHVLTETSNLLAHIEEPAKSELFRCLAAVIETQHERSPASRDAIRRAEYLRLGLPDSVLLEMAKTGSHLLTDDLALYLAASYSGLPVTNFTHIRDQRSDFS